MFKIANTKRTTGRPLEEKFHVLHHLHGLIYRQDLNRSLTCRFAARKHLVSYWKSHQTRRVTGIYFNGLLNPANKASLCTPTIGSYLKTATEYYANQNTKHDLKSFSKNKTKVRGDVIRTPTKIMSANITPFQAQLFLWSELMEKFIPYEFLGHKVQNTLSN